MKKLLPPFLLMIYFLLSCNNKQAGAVEINTEKYTADSKQSIIQWTGYKIEDSLNISHFGTVELKAGTISWSDTDNKILNACFTADLSTLTNKDLSQPETRKTLIKQLTDSSFLNILKYPEASFTIEETHPITGLSDYNTQITGILKIKNTSHVISFKANVFKEGNQLSFYSEKFPVYLKDFQINTQKNRKGIQEYFDLQTAIILILNN